MLENLPPVDSALPTAPCVGPLRIAPPGRPWQERDLHALSDTAWHVELVRGELRIMNPASPTQGIFAMRLGAALFNYVDTHGLGVVITAEPGFKLHEVPELTVRVTDIAFVRTERIPPQAQQAGFWPLAPDLVIEIISPSETASSIQEKVQDFLTAGTRLVWLVYPDTRSLVEYGQGHQMRHYSNTDFLEGDEVLPGFTYPLKRLFE